MGDFIFIGSVFCALISAYLLLFKKNIVHLFSDKILAILFLIIVVISYVKKEFKNLEKELIKGFIKGA